MKKLVLMTLMMVLGLSGCASSGTINPIKQDWAAYWEVESKGWERAKQDWAMYWANESRGWGQLK